MHPTTWFKGFRLKGTIQNTLRKIGLTEKERELYVFISKKGAITGTEIARLLKLNKGQAYRLLKNLQKKGVIEVTLEYPTHYIPVPFEKVVDNFIKNRRLEVDKIENTKESLLLDWKKISQEDVDYSFEKFAVIEGEQKVIQKISEMLVNAKCNFSCALSITNLVRAEQFRIFESMKNRKTELDFPFRILTQPTKKCLKTVEHLEKIFPKTVKFRARNAEVGISYLPQMVIKDKDEILLFISETNIASNSKDNITCLYTNSKCIIQSFLGVFNDCWEKSSLIEDKLLEIETGKSSPTMEIIKEPTTAKNCYYKELESAKTEIVIVTSNSNLSEICKKSKHLQKIAEKGISIKIMAPITCENLKYAQKLLQFSEVRHIPVGYRETTIIDETALFQFNIPEKVDGEEIFNFKNTFYTNNSNFIIQTKRNILDIWEKTHVPNSNCIQNLIRTNSTKKEASIDHPLLQKRSYNIGIKYAQEGTISKNDVLTKIKTEQKSVHNQTGNKSDIMRFFGQRAFALIDPPKALKLPKMIIGIFVDDSNSSSEGQKYMVIDVLQTHKNIKKFVPIACVQDSTKLLNFRKNKHSGDILANNIQVVDKERFQVHVKGNTLFAGWTVHIPLKIYKKSIPPACVLFEGFGETKSGMFTSETTTNHDYEIWYNSLDAFVTFFLPRMKYVGSGTEGFIDMDSVWISKSSS